MLQFSLHNKHDFLFYHYLWAGRIHRLNDNIRDVYFLSIHMYLDDKPAVFREIGRDGEEFCLFGHLKQPLLTFLSKNSKGNK